MPEPKCDHVEKELLLIGLDQTGENLYSISMQCECGVIIARDRECALVFDADKRPIGIAIKVAPVEFVTVEANLKVDKIEV